MATKQPRSRHHKHRCHLWSCLLDRMAYLANRLLPLQSLSLAHGGIPRQIRLDFGRNQLWSQAKRQMATPHLPRDVHFSTRMLLLKCHCASRVPLAPTCFVVCLLHHHDVILGLLHAFRHQICQQNGDLQWGDHLILTVPSTVLLGLCLERLGQVQSGPHLHGNHGSKCRCAPVFHDDDKRLSH